MNYLPDTKSHQMHTDSLDRLLIAPLLGVIGYFVHKALYVSMFIWFAPQVKGVAFWFLLVLSQICAALIVALSAALPLAYFYRERTIWSGFVMWAVMAGIYGYVILTGLTRSNLNMFLEALKIGFLLLLLPITAVWASKNMLPRLEMAFGKGRADG